MHRRSLGIAFCSAPLEGSGHSLKTVLQWKMVHGPGVQSKRENGVSERKAICILGKAGTEGGGGGGGIIVCVWKSARRHLGMALAQNFWTKMVLGSIFLFKSIQVRNGEIPSLGGRLHCHIFCLKSLTVYTTFPEHELSYSGESVLLLTQTVQKKGNRHDRAGTGKISNLVGQSTLVWFVF